MIFGDVTDSFVDFAFFAQCVDADISCDPIDENDPIMDNIECLKEKYGKCLMDIDNKEELQELLGTSYE